MRIRMLLVIGWCLLSTSAWAVEYIFNGNFDAPTPVTGGIPNWITISVGDTSVTGNYYPRIDQAVIPNATPQPPQALLGSTGGANVTAFGYAEMKQSILVPRDAIGTLTFYYQWHADPSAAWYPGYCYAEGNFGGISLFRKYALMTPTPAPTPGYEKMSIPIRNIGVPAQTWDLVFTTHEDQAGLGTFQFNSLNIDGVSLDLVTATQTITTTITPTFTKTPTYTITRTVTHTRTITSTLTISPTRSPTATLTPYTVPPGDVLAYPNPVSTGNMVYFTYSLLEPCKVTIDIYNLSGVRVAHLEDPGRPAKFGQATSWKVSTVAPGMYFYKFMTDSVSGQHVVSKIKKLLIAR